MAAACKVSWKDKVSHAATGSFGDESGSLDNMQRNTLLWGAVTVFLVVSTLSARPRTARFDRGSGADWNLWTASIFGFGALFAALARSTARTTEKQRLATVLLLCNALSAVTYILVANRLGLVLPGNNTRPVDVARFLEWLATCPVLILLIAEVTKNRGLGARIMAYDYIMLVCGFCASITRNPFAELFTWGAIGCFFLVMQGLWTMFSNAVDGNSCTLSKTALVQARNVTCFSWTCCTASLTQFLPRGHWQSTASCRSQSSSSCTDMLTFWPRWCSPSFWSTPPSSRHTRSASMLSRELPPRCRPSWETPTSCSNA